MKTSHTMDENEIEELFDEEESHKGHNQFTEWLNSSHTALLSLVTVIVTSVINIFALVLKVSSFTKFVEEDVDRIFAILFDINYALQFIFLLAIVAHYSRIRNEKQLDTARARSYLETLFSVHKRLPAFFTGLEDNLRRLGTLNLMIFNNYWQKFWGTTLTLYFLFWAGKIIYPHGYSNGVTDGHILISCCSDFVNSLSGLFLFMCFLILHEPIQWKEKKFDISQQRYKVHSYFPPLLFALLIIGVVQFMALKFAISFDINTVVKHEITAYEANQIHLGYFRRASECFSILSGLITGMAMALFAARIDSKFIHVKSYLIFIIYLYAAIQPLYGFFPDEGIVKLVVLYTALLLKVHFFLIVSYVINTGRLMDFMLVFPFLNDFVNRHIWKESGREKTAPGADNVAKVYRIIHTRIITRKLREDIVITGKEPPDSDL